MKKITNQDELLLSMASAGDPAAFYSLCTPFVKQLLFAAKATLHNPDQAIAKVIEDTCQLFHQFVSAAPNNGDEWIEKKIAALLTTDQQHSKIQITEQELALLHVAIEKRLQQVSSELRHKTSRVSSIHTIKIALRKASTVLLHGSIGIAAVLTAAIASLLITGSSITIALNGPLRIQAISFPPLKNNPPIQLVDDSKPADTLSTVDVPIVKESTPSIATKQTNKSDVDLKKTDAVLINNSSKTIAKTVPVLLEKPKVVVTEKKLHIPSEIVTSEKVNKVKPVSSVQHDNENRASLQSESIPKPTPTASPRNTPVTKNSIATTTQAETTKEKVNPFEIDDSYTATSPSTSDEKPSTPQNTSEE